jgi:hypothetical protein
MIYSFIGHNVACLLKVRIMKPAERTVARERLWEHARCKAMAQYPSRDGRRRRAQQKKCYWKRCFRCLLIQRHRRPPVNSCTVGPDSLYPSPFQFVAMSASAIPRCASSRQILVAKSMSAVRPRFWLVLQRLCDALAPAARNAPCLPVWRQGLLLWPTFSPAVRRMLDAQAEYVPSISPWGGLWEWWCSSMYSSSRY